MSRILYCPYPDQSRSREAPAAIEAPTTSLSCAEPVKVGLITDATGLLAIYGAHILRSLMPGYNPFFFKLAALLLSSLTAALAGFLHTRYQPIVGPNVASLGFTVTALLIILIGGVGTLNGALVGAAVYRLLDFGLRRNIGESASLINGAIYVASVLFLPFGSLEPGGCDLCR